MCTRPLTAFSNPEGGRPIFGYEGVRLGLPKLQLPCGRCPECARDYYTQWATRGSRELSRWDHSIFITLTYDDEHLPPNNSLDKRSSTFIKKLKNTLVQPKKIRFDKPTVVNMANIPNVLTTM